MIIRRRQRRCAGSGGDKSPGVLCVRARFLGLPPPEELPPSKTCTYVRIRSFGGVLEKIMEGFPP